MTRPLRLLLLCLLAVAGTATACGDDKAALRTVGETEAFLLDLSGLRYQVQISRYLNPADIEDAQYLKGLPEGVRPTKDQTWFAVFLRVQNTSSETHAMAREYEIEDTLGKTYRPVPLDRKANSFVFQPRELRPGNLEPHPDSAAGQGPIQGSLLLFRIDYESTQNRPLEFRIISPENPDEVAVVSLDV
jgi:hypothetical protein